MAAAEIDLGQGPQGNHQNEEDVHLKWMKCAMEMVKRATIFSDLPQLTASRQRRHSPHKKYQ